MSEDERTELVSPPEHSDDTQADRGQTIERSSKKHAVTYAAVGIALLVLMIGGGWYGYRTLTPQGEPAPPADSPDSTRQGSSQASEDAYGDDAGEPTPPPDPTPPLDFQYTVYSHGDRHDSPGGVYARPFQDGDRTQLRPLQNMRNIAHVYDPGVSTKYTFVLNKTELWVGANGQPPEKVHEIAGNSNRHISSPSLSRDGSKIAFGVASVSGNKDKAPIYTLDPASGKTKKIYEGAKANNVFWWVPLQWTPDHNKLFLKWGALGTEAPPPGYGLLDVVTGKVTKIVEGGYTLGEFATSPDGNVIAYSRATEDKDQPQPGLIGHYIGKPYTLYIKNLETGRRNTVTTSDSRFHDLRWVENRRDPRLAYTTGDAIQLYDPTEETDIKTYQYPGQPIQRILAITPEEALVEVEHDKGDEDVASALLYVDLEAKDSQRVTLLTFVTNIVGITGKPIGE